MKKILIPLFLVGSITIQAQEMSTRDSITRFYDSLLYQLQTNYLHKEETDWDAVMPIKEKALQANSFGRSLSHCVALFDQIEGSHLNLFSDFGWFKWSKGRQYQQEDFNINFLLEYEKKPGFKISILQDKYGYILMPGMLMLDMSQDSINRVTQDMYDQIMEVNTSNTIKGWIIDLRFNIGGNVFPMLSALYHFLGDGIAYTSIDKAGEITFRAPMKNGTIYDESKIMASITPTSEPDLQVPIAFITGMLTASSGELIPVSFRGRKNVVTIGEPTAGMLTGNDLTTLPFDVKITLTTGYLADRMGRHTTLIQPEIEVVKEANFQDLMLDQNIKEAIKYIDRKIR